MDCFCSEFGPRLSYLIPSPESNQNDRLKDLHFSKKVGLFFNEPILFIERKKIEKSVVPPCTDAW